MKRIIGITTLMGAALLAASGAARAVPVTPIVSGSTASVGTFAAVPPEPGSIFPLPILNFAVDAQPTNATAAASASNVPLGGAETADGAAEVSLDPTDINNSVVKAKSSVITADAPAPPSSEFFTTDRSVSGFSATLSTEGLAPGDTATVNLQLDVSGSLIYTDPSGAASTFDVVDPFDPMNVDIVSDMTANVSVIVALADVIPVTDGAILGVDIPDPLPFEALFNGSAVLQSTNGENTAPELVREGDWADAARDADFATIGPCDQFFCQIDIVTSILFEDVQSLGFGETFELGLVVLTNVEGISDSGRSLVSNFFDTATFDVFYEIDILSPVPEPATWLLVALGLAAFGVKRNRSV